MTIATVYTLRGERLDTERPNPASAELGAMDPLGVITVMGDADHTMLQAVDHVSVDLATVAAHVATSFLASGRTVFFGAGTSGRLAMQEVAELPPTFGVDPDLFIALVASKAPGVGAIAASEDDAEQVVGHAAELGLGANDVAIGVAASGRTPFVLAGLQAASDAGAWCVAIVNNPDTPLARIADMEILLRTGPEVLTGSTRLKAGTAQKIAMNRVTTAAMVAAGRVTGNYMTELTGTNSKLRDRSVDIVTELCVVDRPAAVKALTNSDWHVKSAIELLRSRRS